MLKRKPSAILSIAAFMWMPIATHPHHHAHPAQHKFVSRYCKQTASAYIGGPTDTVCCKWHSYFKSIPDGAGYWDCTITSDPVIKAGTGS